MIQHPEDRNHACWRSYTPHMQKVLDRMKPEDREAFEREPKGEKLKKYVDAFQDEEL